MAGWLPGRRSATEGDMPPHMCVDGDNNTTSLWREFEGSNYTEAEGVATVRRMRLTAEFGRCSVAGDDLHKSIDLFNYRCARRSSRSILAVERNERRRSTYKFTLTFSIDNTIVFELHAPLNEKPPTICT